MQIVAIQLFNGLVYGMLLFLMSARLSLIFGLMNVVNISHGSFFMLGAFVAVAVAQATGSFWVALAVAWIPAVALGAVVERVFLRTLYARGHLDQVLPTFGFTFAFTDLARWVSSPGLLIPSFLVVVLGGAARMRGALIASLFVGLIDTLGQAYFPDSALFVVYLLMVVMLLSRPNGLFGIARACGPRGGRRWSCAGPSC